MVCYGMLVHVDTVKEPESRTTAIIAGYKHFLLMLKDTERTRTHLSPPNAKRKKFLLCSFALSTMVHIFHEKGSWVPGVPVEIDVNNASYLRHHYSTVRVVSTLPEAPQIDESHAIYCLHAYKCFDVNCISASGTS